MMATAIAVAGLLTIVAPPAAFAAGSTLTWTAQAPMPTPRGRVGLTTDSGGAVYVFGGETTQGAVDTVARYDSAANTWSSRAPMPTPLTGVRPVRANDGRIYVIGGANASLDTATVVTMYDPAADTWTPRRDLPVKALGAAGALGPDGKIYVFGGYPGCCFGYNNNVFAYDTASAWIHRRVSGVDRVVTGQMPSELG